MSEKVLLSKESKTLESDFSTRLSEIIGQESARSFARTFEIPETTLRQYLSSRSEPTLSNLLKLAEAGQVNLLWLATGKGPKTGEKDGNAEVSVTNPEFEEDYALIPGYHLEVSAGSGSAWNGEEVMRHLAFRKNWLNYRRLNPKSLKVVFAKGDSMEPTINSGDSILVDSDRTILEDGSIFVLRLGEELYAKRLQKRFDGGIEIISDNKEYTSQVVPADELGMLHIIGKVVWVGKDIT